MREIQLSRGKTAVVDDDDYDAILAQGYSWYCINNGFRDYAFGHKKGDGGYILMHRLIAKAPQGVEVDHINRDGLDNRRCNLRLATRQQNQANSGLSTRNKSGYRGVSWRSSKGKYRACITIGGKKHHIGYFWTPEAAARAYDNAAREAFGEFASTNF